MERHTFVVGIDRDGSTVNKLVKVEDKSEVLEKAKRAFAVTGEFRVEYYFEPCNEYIEVDSLDELPDRGKVRIVPVLKPIPLESSAGLSSPCDFSTASTVELSPGDPLMLTGSFSPAPTTPPMVIIPPSSASSV